jgi:hypothetical protein
VPSLNTSPRVSPVRRACAQRACTAQARQRIQDTLEWESCDENSHRFVAVEQEYDEAFSKEVLDDESESAGSDSAENESESDDDDESYESSFVDDGSSSEYEDSDDEWTPLKRSRLSSEPQGAVLEEDVPSRDDEHGSASEPADCAPSAPISPTFLHMEEFAASARESAAQSAAQSEDVTPCPAASVLPDSAAATSYLHAEELDSPPGFYNLWVL